MNKTYNLLQSLPKFISIGIAFLMPVFFLPYTSEFFEFNKWVLLLVATLVLLVLVGVNILLTQRFRVSKAPIDLPLIAFIAVVVLSTVFSVHKPSSIFGSYGRWFPSLMGLLTVVFYYYLSTPTLDNETSIRRSLYAFLAGGSVSTLVALLSYFKIYLSDASYVQSLSFNLTGSITTTVVLAALAAIISFALLVYSNQVTKKAVLTATLLLNLLFVLLVGITTGWILLVIGFVLVLLSTPTQKLQQNKMDLMIIAGAALAMLIVFTYPETRNVIVNANYPKELSLSVQESWITASSSVRDFPILGSGPSTFYLNFPRYKSAVFNNTDFWNIRFDKPFNEGFNILATMGILGAVAAAYLGIRTLKFAFNVNKKEEGWDGETVAIRVSLLLALATFLLTYATVLNTFVFFFMLSLLVAKINLKNADNIEDMMSSLSSISFISEGTRAKKPMYSHFIIAGIFGILAVLTGYQAYKVYAAEYYTRMGINATQANDGVAALRYQGMAINTNPQMDAYQTVYSQTNLALANAIAGNTELTDTDKQNIQALIAESIRSIRVATEVLNPLNVNNWEIRGGIYRSLIGVADNADQWALSSYNTAIQLDPANPRLRVNLGGVYYLAQDYLQAANQFRQAIILKQDYANAYYNFAQALALLKDYDNAKSALETVKRLVPADSADAQQVDKDLATLADMASTPSSNSTVPSIEELSQPVTTTSPSSQEPLSKPDEKQNP